MEIKLRKRGANHPSSKPCRITAKRKIMKKYKVYLTVKRNKDDKMVFETEDEIAAIVYIKNVVRYFEPFEEGFHDEEDEGRYYIFNGIEQTYISRTYEIPR